ncbi:MAG: ATP-binding protein, partial [Proteobacteria bacterium]|nr:ATP-binding protein [Pseudomonadota bacterium]
FAQGAQHKGLRIESEWVGPSGQRYQGDPHRLAQMLSNLVGNAVKFTAQGEIRIEAREIQRTQDAAVLEFSVADTGIGISPEQQAKLFQHFSQADSSTTRRFGGSGLGLSIVRNLAVLMGGEAGVDSTEGQGSRFWFRITAPLRGPDADARQSPGWSGMAAGPLDQTTQFDGKVLAVEDNAINRMVIQALLTKLGVSVAFADHGAQAIEAISQGAEVDLILMDLRMPVMDGYEATEQIRRWEATNGRERRPIIAMTADAYAEDRRHCLEVGMDDVLTKPIFLADLQIALSRWLPDTAKTLVTSPAGTPVGRPMDVPLIANLLRELRPLLELNRFNALAKFRELEELVADSEVSAEIADVGRQLRLMQFDGALERLTEIAKKQDWTI